MNEKVANNFVGDWGQEIHTKCQIVPNFDQHAAWHIPKCPDNMHSFCERFQMMKADFKTLAIHVLLGSLGNRNAGAGRRHHDNVPVRAAFEITNVAIVRQYFRPQLQVRGRFEDHRFRSVHDD
jgi:hypothetical protein